MLLQLARGIGSLLFPAVCPGCRRPVESGPCAPLCAACLGSLPRCRFPGGKLRHVDGTVSPFLYEGACRELVLALKYQGRISLVPFLADRMAEETLRQLGLPATEAAPSMLPRKCRAAGAARPQRILPVPLHPTRLRERTFNQAELLARALADRMGIPCDGNLLIRCRPTRPQAELTREERSRNVRGAFILSPSASSGQALSKDSGAGLKGSRLLLVDDVLTTGATAEACAALLKKAGARSVWVVTAARD